ncbi:hypothetical protein [Coleofasciculus sp. FACHB-SPT9]|uniref:hypothetical protein n=1 Tax=Cyanophyceae TaxID=3028117 RepID=UPI00168981E2|nr:hypothetical protein [Coleofasciculus sp. FACHB-SPT9]MBD1892926.1 hypothetical protein [Coleofasciculus sp. FACHB-SPT9]
MKVAGILGLAIGSWSVLFSQPVKAEMLTLGTASGGQTVRLDTTSIPRSRQSVSSGSIFVYYLGNRRIAAEANCSTGTWAADGTDHRPQSKATRNMLSIVCSGRYAEPIEDMGNVLVFDPPSKVRSSPGGSVKCTLSEMVVISVYVEPDNGWYSTDACDGGWIHSSQIRPFD